MAAAAVYDFSLIEHKEEVTIDATNASFSFGDLAKGVGEYIKDNPDQVLNAAADVIEAQKALAEGKQVVASAAPAMHESALACLRAQGFAIEVDVARSQQLGATVDADKAYVGPNTSVRTFDTFPVFGPGSASWIVERVSTPRPSEAYASIHAEFQSEANRAGNPVSCHLRIAILDRNGVQIFGGDTVGTAEPRDSRSETFKAAFAAALQPMGAPETLK